jgi:nicotinate-nucleotide--dimethylbenzimidazole phosphoribosyltransferase
MPSPAATFDEIRAVAASLPAGGFVWQPAVAHPRIVLYAATHGIAIGLSGGSPQAMTALVNDMVNGHGPLHALVEQADADLKLYDLALDRPTRDSRLIQAVGEVEASRASAYGMMAVEPGIDIFTVAALGDGAALAGTALATALASGNVVIDGPAGTALARHGALDDPLELLAALGGPDIAAILGVILAARLAAIPVILDGIAAYAAAAVARALRPDALAHCRLATGEAGAFSAAALGLQAVLPGPDDSPLSGARALMAVMG